MRRTLLAAAIIAIAAPSLAASPAPHVVVFFGSWSARLDKPAMKAVEKAADWAKQHPAEKLTVIGYASTIGSVPANRLLAELRSQIVSDALVTDGVKQERIEQRSAGATAYAMDPVESRRVDIALGEE